MEKVTGYIDNFIYRNQDNGYCVLTLNTEDGGLTCVGTLQGVVEGMNVEFTGSYTEHPSYGRQFRVESYEEKEPEDEFAIERYLGSGAVKGIGAALAARIVRKFGRDTFRIIEEEPERLAEIRGISERKAQEIAAQVEEKRGMRQAMIFLQQFGISLENQNYERFLVSGRQRYRPCAYSVEADWSQAAFWYAANFVGCQVTLEGLNFDSAQGDKQAAALYWPMARPGDLDIDLAHIPDLAPPLAAMAAVRRGVTRFVHAGRLRLKESDRIAAITDALNALGAQAEETPDGFVVHGMPQLEGGGTVDCRNDHRIAMMAGVLACCAQRPSTLLGAECVEKSYPQFWAEFARLGGDSHVLALG